MKTRSGSVVLLYLIFLLVCTSAKAAPPFDGRITGKITDKTTGKPIAGATITIPDLNTGTSTDANGAYELKDLPSGKYLVQVSAIGYGDVTETIDLGSTTTVDFKLPASNYELADVVITALG
ncbi:MAG TPA: carboxypeptidase-like regulatory domain-containing protein, partial [Mucilaginibacter sp.]|nr:carboxypeptidase-like regulatory domain-containing protein [Mucilaginibacter sp.]